MTDDPKPLSFPHMKTLHLAKLLAGLCLTALGGLHASVTINFEGGLLYGADTATPLADGALIYAVARPAATNFVGPTAGSFVGKNEIFLGKWTTDSVNLSPGEFSAALYLDLDDGLSTGMDVWLVWFPDLTPASASPSPGFVYGAYHDASWIIPSDGETETLILLTEALGGALPDSAFVANRIVGSQIPEPAAFAFLAGLAGMVCAAAKRRRR